MLHFPVVTDTNAYPKTPGKSWLDHARPLWRRYCYILLMAGWMGGFTFYALIVIPSAERVLGSIRDTGFITQQVTRWLNIIGASVLVITLWLWTANWKKQPPRLRASVVGCWLIMALAQLGLFFTHPFMDALLEAQGHKLQHFERFENLHTLYLTFATTQWCAALLQIWLLLAIWRAQDQKPDGP